MERTRFHVTALLNDALAMARERATAHGILLELTTDADVAWIVADERKVKQVMFNLLANAVKFTADGGCVRVVARRDSQWLQVSVNDSGPGISQQDRDRIFEAVQGDPTAERTREETGLGLTLSRQFVELHGGRLWVESVEGRGSTFTFTLP